MRNQIVYLLVITILSCVPTSAELDWIRISTEYTPPKTDGHNMVYSMSSHEIVMFGGIQFDHRDQPLYFYDGADWMIQTPEGNWPSWRSNFGMAYDASRNVVVVFGGWQGSYDYLGDTWEWDGSQWEEKFPEHSPEDRICPAFVHAGEFGLIMYGGYTEDRTYVDDLWTWDGSDWSEIQCNEFPNPTRISSPLTYDSTRNRIVLFGGTDNGSNRLSDTWEWDGITWHQTETNTFPDGKYAHVMVFDESKSRCVLFGGALNSSTNSDETWEYDGNDWTQIFPSHHPSERGLSAACYDSNRQRIVLYGGYTWSGSNNETWEYYDVPTPTITPSPTVTPSPPPPTVTPTSTATPQDGIALSLDLPDHPVHTGDAFYLDISINSNHSSDLSSMPMFCILEVAGSFWYYPTWEMTPSWETITVHPGNQIVPILPEFPWPADCGSGSARFWAALTDMEITRIFGNVDVRDVAWEE